MRWEAILFPKEVPSAVRASSKCWASIAKAEFTMGSPRSYSQKTTEVNFNYIIKQFNARVMTFFQDTRFNQKTIPNTWQAGIGLQIQM